MLLIPVLGLAQPAGLSDISVVWNRHTYSYLIRDTGLIISLHNFLLKGVPFVRRSEKKLQNFGHLLIVNAAAEIIKSCTSKSLCSGQSHIFSSI